MAKYSAVKATVNAYIKQNGRKEITGRILNAVLNATIDSLGKYFQFAGGALPTDDPGTPDQNVCYLAGEPGVYTNFGGITIENEEVALLFWDGEWTKQRILIGIREVNASVDNQVGTPSVDVSYSGGELVLTFHNLKGEQGETGDPAGFGTIGADINGGVGTPGVSVETSGDNTAKNLMFHFTNLKGETGVTSVVATIDDTSGTPSCQVSLVGQQLTLAFSGLKGLKGDTGVSADYPITIYNGLDSDATDQALAAAQGKVLDGKVGQLEAKVDDISAEEAPDTDEEIKITTDDGQTILLEITSSGVDAKNLKSNGAPVVTDVSNLATKTELQTGLAEKQDEIEEISIDDTHDSEDKEQIWASEDYDEDLGTGEAYVKIGAQGIHTKNVLMGKKWAPLGDSFTAGATSSTLADGKYKGQKRVYPYFIGNRTGVDVLSTFFASGRTLAWPANPGTFTNSICNPNAACYYQNIPADVDFITIYLGINDSHHAPGSGGGDGEDNTGEIPIGTISDNDTSTYYGAWNVVLSWLIENRPFTHIGIIVSNGCDSVDYRNAQIAIARKYGIPFIDLNGDDRTPFMIRSTNPDIPSEIRSLRTQAQAVNYPSNTHPNDDAHLFESWFIEEFLKTI